jgi:raffinose/stachyose/melibiose transport system substrate-binding protein
VSHKAALSNTLSRRQLVKATGGVVAGAALAGTLGSQARFARAQDAVTITMWSNHPEWQDQNLALIAAFEAANPDVKIELTSIPGQDYQTKLQTALAAKEVPDVLTLVEGDIYGKYGPAGELPCIDLTGKIDSSQLTDLARLQVDFDGKSYGTPLASYTVGLAVQKKIFEEHGLTPPTTWDEFKATSQSFKDAGMTPLTLGASDGVHTFFMYIGLVSSILDVDGFQQLLRGERNLTDPDLLTAAQMLVDMKGFYNEGFEATDYVSAKALFAQGLSAMMVAGTADFTGFKEENPDSDLDFIPWPGPEAGKYATNTGFELLHTVSSYASPEKQEAATKWVVWLAGTEAQTMVGESIALPVNKNVTELSDPIRLKTLSVRDKDIPVWYALPETNATFPLALQISGQLWTGELTPEGFAEQMQAAIKPSGGSGTPVAS